MTKIIRMYLHSDKDSNYERGESLGLKDEALHTFAYALGEVGFDVEVDMETGETTILEVDSRKLE